MIRNTTVGSASLAPNTSNCCLDFLSLNRILPLLPCSLSPRWAAHKQLSEKSGKVVELESSNQALQARLTEALAGLER